MNTVSLKILVPAILTILLGCSSPQSTIYINSTPDTNNKRSFYVVVRSIDRPTYLLEDYQTVANKVFVTPRDVTILKSEPVYPGIDKEIVLDELEKAVAIYFLFTRPGNKWKAYIEAPLATSIDIELEGNGIKTLD